MRQFLFSVAVLAMSMAASAAGLSDVKTVYLMPMSNGLDQYLAVQLTTGAVLQVVVDPQRADAVLTDHLGESFEQSLADLYSSKTQNSEKDKTDEGGGTFARSGMQGQKGRGNVFLVNSKTHDVLWSSHEFPKDKTPGGMTRTAGRIVAKLAHSLKGN
jgi:hypothetical protein